jgi:hypothetical protein
MKKVSLFVVLIAVMMFVAVPFASAQGGLSGKVIETMNSGGYTYVQIENNGQKTWVAIPQADVKVGQKVTFQPGMLMKNFKSKSLNRVFDEIYFSGGLAK